MISGEAVAARDVNLWGQWTRIVIGYGPCECTIGCTINSSAASGRNYVSIGKGNGAAIWIVEPDDHNTLTPVGNVGELLIEGPIVGEGYLGDPEKTAASFIEDPLWLINGHKDFMGRHGRLYKTGDLVRFDPASPGEFVFVGRKDTQVKLRGQRVELGEIESQLIARLSQDVNVIAEVITPLSTGRQPTLVVFIASRAKSRATAADIEMIELSADLHEALADADDQLRVVLPRYMIPTAYIPINHFPVMISGKTDRKRLRQFGVDVDLQKLKSDSEGSISTREMTDAERDLQQAWALVLKLEPSSVNLEANFFALGGDSLTAMKLVGACRTQGCILTVSAIFEHPVLLDMATKVKTEYHDTSATRSITPFSLLSGDRNTAQCQAAAACGLTVAAVEDIYPCTPTQESLFTFALKSIEPYVAQRVALIPAHITTETWKGAWGQVAAATPILRTRLAQFTESRLAQVVLKEDIQWKHTSDLAEYLKIDQHEPMDLGDSLARYAIVTNSDDGQRHMVLTIHHVIYDGWSEHFILESLKLALQGSPLDDRASMRDFVGFLHSQDEAATQSFWCKELAGAVGPQFPNLPSRDYLPTPNATFEKQILIRTPAGSQFTLPNLIRGAWALVVSQYTSSDDVVFGETFTGRDIPLSCVETIVGPLVATVPVRVQIDRSSTVEAYLLSIQRSLLRRAPHQHAGWQNIRKVSADAQRACETGTGLVFQPKASAVDPELGFATVDAVDEALHFNPYPLMLAFGLDQTNLRVRASFDDSLVDIAQLERMLNQLESTCNTLAQDTSRRLQDVSCLTPVELDQIWAWNRLGPLPLDGSTGRSRANLSITKGSEYPPTMIPWVCSHRTPSVLTPVGCIGELWFESALTFRDSVKNPSWLVAGSLKHPGRFGSIHPTGDLVRLCQDGRIIFVQSKEDTFSLRGNLSNVSDLEIIYAQKLPSDATAIATTLQRRTNSTNEAQEYNLVVVIAHPCSTTRNVRLMSSDYTFEFTAAGPESHSVTICSSISRDLTEALSNCNRIAQDTLPPYMVPSAYILIEDFPTGVDCSHRDLASQMVALIPSHVLTQLQYGLNMAWEIASAQAVVTPEEDCLRKSWAEVLKKRPEEVDINDNFFRLGGDSVLAMKLVSILRKQGHTLTVANIFRHMQLKDAASVLKLNAITPSKPQIYKPFSNLGSADLEAFIAKIRPQMADPNWQIKDICPVMDMQALDVAASIKAPRTSIQYNLLYLDQTIDSEQLIRACKSLTLKHDILRTVFIESESVMYQVILADLDNPFHLEKIEGDLSLTAGQRCEADVEMKITLGTPFVKFMLLTGRSGERCLVFRLSHAQYDGFTLPMLIRDLGDLCEGKALEERQSFSTYITRACDESVQGRAISYWQEVLNASRPSRLSESSPEPSDRSVFRKVSVDAVNLPERTTMATLLITSWALVLARHLHTRDVAFGNVTSGRTVDDIQMDEVVGPCYQMTPVRVLFEREWKAADLLDFVQNQVAASTAYEALGYATIARRCTQWPEHPVPFGSVVHYQDWEDFDEIDFAGGRCKVETMSPHGDASSPVKAVAYVREGCTFVGLVGSEKDQSFLDARLQDLVSAVQELTSSDSHSLLLEPSLFDQPT